VVTGVHRPPRRQQDCDPLVKAVVHSQVKESQAILSMSRLVWIELKKFTKQFKRRSFAVGFAPKCRNASLQSVAFLWLNI